MKHVFPPVACITLVAGMAFAEPAGPPTAVIVNQAADAIVDYLQLEKPLGKGETREMVLAALRQTVDQYQGTGVSHVSWNVNYQRVAYRSAVWPSYWDDLDPEKNVTDWPRKYYELHKLGIDDVFAIVIPRCRERGVSPWISLRMNDHHYTGDPSRVSPLFFEHPELAARRQGFVQLRQAGNSRALSETGCRGARAHDVDGLELDWIRTADNFNIDDIERGRELLYGFHARRAVTNGGGGAAAQSSRAVGGAGAGQAGVAHGLGFMWRRQRARDWWTW